MLPHDDRNGYGSAFSSSKSRCGAGWELGTLARFTPASNVSAYEAYLIVTPASPRGDSSVACDADENGSSNAESGGRQDQSAPFFNTSRRINSGMAFFLPLSMELDFSIQLGPFTGSVAFSIVVLFFCSGGPFPTNDATVAKLAGASCTLTWGPGGLPGNSSFDEALRC